MAHTNTSPKPDDELCCGVIFQQLDGGEMDYESFSYCPHCGTNIAAEVSAYVSA